MNKFWILWGSGPFFGKWQVVVDIFWLVVGGGGYILAGGGWLRVVVGSCGYILAGGGWWWMLVGGGIVYSNPALNGLNTLKQFVGCCR